MEASVEVNFTTGLFVFETVNLAFDTSVNVTGFELSEGRTVLTPERRGPVGVACSNRHGDRSRTRARPAADRHVKAFQLPRSDA